MFTRRRFFGLSLAPFLFSATRSSVVGREFTADLVIVGGGLGGCAAALAACRGGLSVVMTEETDWIGGQLTSQAVPPDEHPWVESFGITRSYRRFRTGVRDYYKANYPLTAEARATAHFNPGDGNVSKLCHEPRVALAVLEAMLAPYVSNRRLVILLECVPIRADIKADRIAAVTVSDRREGHEIVLTAPYFIDATELGDLLPLAGVEFVTGAESQNQTQEKHAPAEAQPANQQAFTYCFAVEYRPGESHTIDKPADYELWRDYVPKMKPPWPGRLLSWSMSDPVTLAERKVHFDPTLTAKGPGLNLWLYRRILSRRNFADGFAASDVSLVNWPQNDYWLGNLVGEPAAEIEKHKVRGKRLSLALLHWMQTEAPRPDGGTGWPGLRLRNDIVGTADGLAKLPYVRESRRIKAEFTVCERHVGTDARMELTGKPRDEVTAEKFADSVGIGSYRIDLHPSTGGDNYIDVSSLPFQIPLGALLPVRVENLLPACKNLGVTHITNGCYRLHPVEWNIGEAAGALIAYCMRKKMLPRQIRNDTKVLQSFQQALRHDGVELEWTKITPR